MRQDISCNMKIVFLEPLGLSVDIIEEACRPLKENGDEVVIYADRNEHVDVLSERACDADVVVVSNIPLTREFFDACPRLKMLSIAFTGLDHIDLGICEERSIVVHNAAGYSTHAVAELTIAMMIDLYRNVIDNDHTTRLCVGRGIMPGRELRGKTVGIVGLGNIGRRVAELSHAFGCKVIAWNRTACAVEGVELVDKETLFSTADIVTIHTALCDETRGMIDSEALSMMKPESILINTSRGPVVDEKALAHALMTHKIAGAAVDVYGQEPPLHPDNILLQTPNLIMLPHIGFATEEAFALRLEIVVDNIMKWISHRDV